MATNITRPVIGRAGAVERRKFLTSVSGIIAVPFLSIRAAEPERSSAVASNASRRRKETPYLENFESAVGGINELAVSLKETASQAESLSGFDDQLVLEPTTDRGRR